MNKLARRSFLITSAISVGLSSASRKISANSVPLKFPLRVGQIGTSHAHAAGKLQALQANAEFFDVVGVVEPDLRRRTMLQNRPEYRSVTWLSEDELLHADDVIGVVVETDIPDLVSTARRCVQAGCHVHMDKPAGTNLSDFRSLCETADTNQRIIQLGYMFRGNPAFQKLYEFADRGILGDIFEVDGVIGKQISQAERLQLARFKGGAMFELGCHLIDAVVRLLGRPQQVTASNHQSGYPSDTLFDNCLATLRYKATNATVRSSLIDPVGGQNRQLLVRGTNGTAEIRPLEPPSLEINLAKPAEGFQSGKQQVDLKLNEGPNQGRYDSELVHWAKAIAGMETFKYSTTHDLIVQETLLEASGMSSEH